MIVGVLAASWQYAIHVPGRYGTIQDLWVHPEWRSRALGRKLVEALVGLAGEQGIARLEVGLPQESFAQLAATERFYLSNGFSNLGPRMRRLLR
jgi:branched-chain amino acid aminotransferase